MVSNEIIAQSTLWATPCAYFSKRAPEFWPVLL